MSNGLNTAFMVNPINFLGNYPGILSSNIRFNGPGGTSYALDGNNIGMFDLKLGNHNTVQLRNYSGGFFSNILGDPPIRAYYLSAFANQTRIIQLGHQANFMFTDSITGCSFKAYGTSRYNITVEHQNELARRIQYAVRRLSIAAMNYNINITYDSTNYRNGGFLLGDDPEFTQVTVIGWRRATGWHFYVRRLLQQPHRPLDIGAFEI